MWTCVAMSPRLVPPAMAQDRTAAAAELAKQEPGPKPRRPNRLATETSPYLLQHAHNPVDWYPWCPEAFEAARAAQKPIFLSIGYSTCYWCHVMERESFESEDIARYLNEHFICIKVDREERPDVDQVYMVAVQAYSGHGGWPMTLFCLPDGRPFFGGTYFPAKPRDGMTPFPELLERVVDAWRDHRGALGADAEKVSSIVRRSLAATDAAQRVPLSMGMIERGVKGLSEQFDREHGGFGFDPVNPRRPKFPEPANLLFLLDEYRRQGAVASRPTPGSGTDSALSMVEKTLDHLSRGGIRDHIGGGYHRYSTDRAWVVPHFEKMLYDNALLALAFLSAYEQTKNHRWADEARSIFEFVERDLTSREGAFLSAIDAEVDGREGEPHVWSRAEVEKVLSHGGFETFARVYGLDQPPNFEGDRHVLLLPRSVADSAKDLGVQPDVLEGRLHPLRSTLLAARRERPQPRVDDKILTSWNGLMIAAYAEGFRVLGDDSYRRSAERAADFIWANLQTRDGRLLRTSRAGQSKVPAYLDDHAYLAQGLVRLAAATGDRGRLTQALTLADQLVERFADDSAGGFYFTAEDHETLMARPKDPYDGALPSANAVALLTLVELAHLFDRPDLLDVTGKALDAFSPAMARTPAGVPMLLTALARFREARPAAVLNAVDDGALAAIDDPLGIGSAGKLVGASVALDEGGAPAAGTSARLSVVVTIAEGWHITANPPGNEMLKPTAIELVSIPGFSLQSVAYPKGTSMELGVSDQPILVYERSVAIPLAITLADDVAVGEHALEFRIHYQVCNDRVCLAPAALVVPFRIKVSPP
jgi:uncharacterized protein YyaL (SSP411 family)